MELRLAFLSAHDGDYKTAIKYYSKILNAEKVLKYSVKEQIVMLL
jgi:uncharacterized glyoxalase superfamily protein PhnB